MATDIVLLVARILIATVFVVSCIDKLRGSPQEWRAIQGLHIPWPAAMERVAGACELIGAMMLIFGVGARLGSVLLALFMIFITIAFLRYWSFAGHPEAKKGQATAFYSNLATVGGLVYITALGPGSLAFLPST